ncbi:SEC-C motif-containing protein / OTU-likecysteine protease family protein [Striga asiatica]|uniref:SEC-C motif-containing protein / OTU-likecysteine protease family protein n=1 Tax=Striga asiatica TaxID=4170 RepID=A0A5A7QYB4_STRAF|nr:SEC-C motif-containing protein / OTU-likecysteine protease family protein [Striga asiatica]
MIEYLQIPILTPTKLVITQQRYIRNVSCIIETPHLPQYLQQRLLTHHIIIFLQNLENFGHNLMPRLPAYRPLGRGRIFEARKGLGDPHICNVVLREYLPRKRAGFPSHLAHLSLPFRKARFSNKRLRADYLTAGQKPNLPKATRLRSRPIITSSSFLRHSSAFSRRPDLIYIAAIVLKVDHFRAPSAEKLAPFYPRSLGTHGKRAICCRCKYRAISLSRIFLILTTPLSQKGHHHIERKDVFLFLISSIRDSAFSLIVERTYAFRREPYILLSIKAIGIFLKYCSALEMPCTFAMRSSWMAASLEVVLNLCGIRCIRWIFSEKRSNFEGARMRMTAHLKR